MRGLLLLLVLLTRCLEGIPRRAELVVRNASVFDSRSKSVAYHRTVVIRDGQISAVLPEGSRKTPEASRVIDADDRLLTPGLVDVHHHIAFVLADSSNGAGGSVAELVMEPDSIAAYRRIFAESYLPHGVTVVREAGGDDACLPLMQDEISDAWRQTRNEILPHDTRGTYLMGILVMFKNMGMENPRMAALISEFAASGATVTPMLHVFAGPLGLAYFDPVPAGGFNDTSGWTEAQMSIARNGYRIMADYVRRLHEAGVALSLGTDTAEPGRSALSEMLLLHDAGIPMEDVLQIATLNSARALDLEYLYGTIEPGKRENLVLFEGNPLEKAEALLGRKTIVKDGHVYAPS